MIEKKKVSFAIVAHVDSGKTELCKRINEIFVKHSKSLDSLEVEKNRGITVKLKQFNFLFNEREYFFIDTPGHSEFFSEVERTINIVDNVLLLVDLTKGIQSSTLIIASILAKTEKKVFVVYNKIDMCDRLKDIEEINEELRKINLNFTHISISAKKNINIDKLVELFNQMKEIEKKDIFAEIFDISSTKFGYRCFFKTYKKIRKNQNVFFPSGMECKVFSIGKGYDSNLEIKETDEIDMGYLAIKTNTPQKLQTGEIYDVKNHNQNYTKDNITSSAMYFQIFPSNQDNKQFHIAVQNLLLNDPSIKSAITNHKVLGGGYTLGVKGKIHMEIVEERLTSEQNLDVIISSPGFFYKVIDIFNKELIIYEADEYDPIKHRTVFEMFSKVNIITFKNYYSPVLETIDKKRGKLVELIDNNENEKVEMSLLIPIVEMDSVFFSTLKQVTHGYITIDTFGNEWVKSQISRLDIMINGEEICGFTFLLPTVNIPDIAAKLVKKISEAMKLRNFEVKVQAKASGKIIKTEVLKARRNDVTSKCYGGDMSRKKKLWEKQKAGRAKQNDSFHNQLTAKDFKYIFKTL